MIHSSVSGDRRSSDCSGSFLRKFSQQFLAMRAKENFKEFYDLAEELGRGRYGTVYKCRRKYDKQTFAMKISRPGLKPGDKELIRREMDIILELRHKNVVRGLECFSSPKNLTIVMEYISGGELFERIVSSNYTLTERECVRFMRRILQGVAYLHQQNIMHLDLKPENILCVAPDSYEIKIVDFGLAQRFDPDHPNDIRSMRGTAEFVAPEVIEFDSLCPGTDMWSVGVIAYVLLSGLSPFAGDTDQETFDNILRLSYDFEDDAFYRTSKAAKRFIAALLVLDKRKRPSAMQCIDNNWISMEKSASVDRLSKENHKKYLARRKWMKLKNVFAATKYFKNSVQQVPKSATSTSLPELSAESSDAKNLVVYYF